MIVWDRGLEFLADDITDLCHDLRIAPLAARAYAPHLKPRIERWNRTLQDEVCRDMPGFLGGPTDARGKSLRRHEAVTEKFFMARFTEWIDHYNLDRPHGGLDEQTPIQTWLSDATPLRTREPHELFGGMQVAKRKHTVTKNGIRFRGRDYVNAQLGKLTDRKVEVRYLPNLRDTIEVFRDGHHVCTAVDARLMRDEEREDFLATRMAEQAELRTIKRAATIRRRSAARADGGYVSLDRKTGEISDLVTTGAAALEELLLAPEQQPADDEQSEYVQGELL